MLKSTISNNSPGHSHNEHTFEVGLSSDICPGNISKRNNIMNVSRSIFLVSLSVLADQYKSVFGFANAMKKQIEKHMEDDRTCILTKVKRYGEIHYELYFDDPQMTWAVDYVLDWQLALNKKPRTDAINGCTLGIYN